MGNSADRAWQLSQLVEGVSTAFNPSYGSLSCVKTNCGVVRVAGYSVVWDCDPTPVFLLKSTKRSAATILGRSAPSLLFHGALRNTLLPAVFLATIHMITSEQTFVNDSLQKIFLLLLLNRIDSIRNLFIIFALDFPALKNPISEKTNCRIQPSSHSSHASSSSSNQSGLSS